VVLNQSGRWAYGRRLCLRLMAMTAVTGLAGLASSTLAAPPPEWQSWPGGVVSPAPVQAPINPPVSSPPAPPPPLAFPQGASAAAPIQGAPPQDMAAQMLLQRVQQLEMEVRQLRGEVERLQYEFGRISQESAAEIAPGSVVLPSAPIVPDAAVQALPGPVEPAHVAPTGPVVAPVKPLTEQLF